MIPQSKWKWFGDAGHLCVCSDCEFHLCTQVGKYLVSTVGWYVPEGSKDHKYKEIGIGRLGETMVFEALDYVCICGCGMPEIGSEIVTNNIKCYYNTRKEANVGHMKICKYFAGRK